MPKKGSEKVSEAVAVTNGAEAPAPAGPAKGHVRVRLRYRAEPLTYWGGGSLPEHSAEAPEFDLPEKKGRELLATQPETYVEVKPDKGTIR